MSFIPHSLPRPTARPRGQYVTHPVSEGRLTRTTAVIVAGVLALAAFTPSLPAQQSTRLGTPLPLEEILALRGHNARSPISISPDGNWVAHTIRTTDVLVRDSLSRRFSATGVAFAEGPSRMEATLSNAATEEVITLGDPGSSSWGPQWSPAGDRVAFYSDEGGTAGLWIWDRADRQRTKVRNLVVRPIFGFETIRWSADGSRLLVRALPEEMSVAEANAIGAPGRRSAGPAAASTGDDAAVTVRRVTPTTAQSEGMPSPTTPDETRRVEGDVAWAAADLVLLDLASGAVTRVARGEAVRSYAFSPDESRVAYTRFKGGERNSQQSVFDLVVRDQALGTERILGRDLRMGYGTEWSWSPDGRTIAVVASGQLGDGRITLFATDGTGRRLLDDPALPPFATSEGEYPPLWDQSGAHLFVVGNGDLWRVDSRTGRGTKVVDIAGWHIRAPVTGRGAPQLATSADGRTAWLVATDTTAVWSAIHAVDLITGATREVIREDKVYLGVNNLAASARGEAIAFVSSGQQHPDEIWLLDPRSGTTQRASQVNPGLDRYPLGCARVIRWQTDDGEALAGTLLIPPGYRHGMRVPLVVWVYGGARGSRALNTFGLTGLSPTFNMHMLATRGYAVLHPDVPIREGRPMTDILRAVMPGVDAAINLGYADPGRLAVMGQSYGSYSALALITQTQRFKAAVLTAATIHPDLATDYLRAVGYYEEGQGSIGGSLWEFPERFIENSPLYRFDQIATPLLVAQGSRDGDLAAAEAIFTALARLGQPVEYRLYQGEGHVISGAANVADLWNRRLEFLAAHLDLSVAPDGAILFDGASALASRPPNLHEGALRTGP